ncbi:MAG: hypothetical protein DSZ11_02480 [Sulfurovum sp.]|nr:MAG: hypothetical protein DSZ11_02480 [Sulfurovum sp.]
MKTLTLSFAGRKFDIELENDFALYVREELEKCNFSFDKDNEHTHFLRAYLKALKQNYENEKRIEALLLEISASTS